MTVASPLDECEGVAYFYVRPLLTEVVRSPLRTHFARVRRIDQTVDQDGGRPVLGSARIEGAWVVSVEAGVGWLAECARRIKAPVRTGVDPASGGPRRSTPCRGTG